MNKLNQLFLWGTKFIYLLVVCISTLSSSVLVAGTKQSTPCQFNVQFTVAPVCEGSKTKIIVRIDEESGSDNEYNVFIDSKKINTGAQSVVGDFLIIQDYVSGDGRRHMLKVEVVDRPECTYSKEFNALNCFGYCPNSSVEVKAHSRIEKAVNVSSSGFSPQNISNSVGDRVKFVAKENGVRVVSLDDAYAWDSGLLRKGDTYYVRPPVAGQLKYALYADTTIGGSIVNSCSTGSKQKITIAFDNKQIYEEGYRVEIDGFDLDATTYPYDPSGHTILDYTVEADGLDHKIGIVDVRTNCKIQGAYAAVNCGSSYPCGLRLESERLSRCDFDKVAYGVRGYSLGNDVPSVELYRNGRLLEEFDVPGRSFEKVYELEGNGGVDTLVVYSDNNFQCLDTLLVHKPNCSDVCEYIRLELEGESRNSTIIRIGENEEREEIVYNEVGQQIYFSFTSDKEIGVRYTSGDSLNYDSGLRTLGHVYIPYLLPVGRHEVEVYDEEGLMYTRRIYVAGYFEQPNLEVAYTLTDRGGSSEGYDVYVDNEKYNTESLQYSIYGDTEGTLLLKGDDRMHEIRFVDKRYPETQLSRQFYLPAFRPSACNKKMEISVRDTCYNNDEYDLDIRFENKDSYGNGFHLFRNGNPISGLITYDSLYSGTHTIRVPGDGSSSKYTAIDAYDQGCNESITHVSKVCETNCEFNGLRADAIDDAFYAAHPETPVNFVGCSDSTQYYRVSFYEKYSDGSLYTVRLNGLNYSTFSYNDGDGFNSFYIPIEGDGKMQMIEITDMEDPSCKAAVDFRAVECYEPCRLEIGRLQALACNFGVAQYELQLSDASSSSPFDLFIDDKIKNHDKNENILSFNQPGDGKSYTVKIQAKRSKDSLCSDTKVMTTPYCLPCNFTATYTKDGACDEDSTAVYAFTVTSFSSDIIRITTPREQIVHDLVEDGQTIYFKLHSDGSEQIVKIQPIEDERCTSEIKIKTEDCTPRFCTPEYSYTYDGMEYEFRDESTATDPIDMTQWMINDQSVEGGEVLKYEFKEAGTFKVCRVIGTAYCQEQNCKEVEVQDPCLATGVSFEHKLNAFTLNIQNTVAEQYDFITYDFGDGTKKNSWNPTHTYSEPGTYKVCATVEYAKYKCKVKFCVDVVVKSTATEDPLSASISLYPNPASSKSILVVQGVSMEDIKTVSFVDINGVEQSVRYVSAGGDFIHIKHSNLPAGSYILRIKTLQGVVNKKVLIY